jgi:2-polyprenyl-3-methyl-5-hydroxy-6-metoxy-1,4-benzoquinol methylase
MKYGVIPTTLLERLALWTGRVPVPALDLLFGLLKSRAVMAGVRLGVFEALRNGGHRAGDLATRLGLDPECLELLLRVLVLFEYVEPRGTRYRLSRLGRRTMIAGGAMELIGFAEWNYTQWEFIARLEDVIRTGRGLDFHETLRDPAAWAHYQRAMLERARVEAPVVAARVPVPARARRLLDVAGAHGLLGAAICRRHPPLRSTVLDLPQAIEHARALARAERIDDVVEHRAADVMRDDLGSGFDVVLLSHILHHVRDPDGRALVARARRALGRGGTAAIWELEAPRHGTKVTAGDGAALFFRLTSSAGARHGAEYANWLKEAGFTRVRAMRAPLSPGSVLVVGRAP